MERAIHFVETRAAREVKMGLLAETNYVSALWAIAAIITALGVLIAALRKPAPRWDPPPPPPIDGKATGLLDALVDIFKEQKVSRHSLQCLAQAHGPVPFPEVVESVRGFISPDLPERAVLRALRIMTAGPLVKTTYRQNHKQNDVEMFSITQLGSECWDRINGRKPEPPAAGKSGSPVPELTHLLEDMIKAQVPQAEGSAEAE
jgi:hypothetical protein